MNHHSPDDLEEYYNRHTINFHDGLFEIQVTLRIYDRWSFMDVDIKCNGRLIQHDTSGISTNTATAIVDNSKSFVSEHGIKFSLTPNK